MDCTLVIPQYGNEQLTAQCLRSFRRHHGRNVEVVVVDDGSPGAQHVSASSSTERTRWLRQPHGGVTSAWNSGWQAGRSELVVFLNNDTVSTGEWLPRLLESFHDPHTLICGCGWRRERHLPSGLPIPSRLLDGWCFAVRRRLLERCGGFDPRLRLYFSDTDLQLRALLLEGGRRSLTSVRGLPLQHIGHATTHQCPTIAALWRSDCRGFQAKWQRLFECWPLLSGQPLSLLAAERESSR